MTRQQDRSRTVTHKQMGRLYASLTAEKMITHVMRMALSYAQRNFLNYCEQNPNKKFVVFYADYLHD